MGTHENENANRENGGQYIRRSRRAERGKEEKVSPISSVPEFLWHLLRSSLGRRLIVRFLPRRIQRGEREHGATLGASPARDVSRRSAITSRSKERREVSQKHDDHLTVIFADLRPIATGQRGEGAGRRRRQRGDGLGAINRKKWRREWPQRAGVWRAARIGTRRRSSRYTRGFC